MEGTSGDTGIAGVCKRDFADFDHNTLKKATDIVWELLGEDNERMADLFYDLFQGMDSLVTETYLPEIIERCIKPGVQLSERAMKNYWLQPLRTGEGHSGCDTEWGNKLVGDVFFQLHLDAPVGFALMCKDKPNAIAGLTLSDYETLRIHQMQGITARRSYDQTKKVFPGGLMQLDWTKLLVECAEDIAMALGFDKVSIIRAENVAWTNQAEGCAGNAMAMERAVEIYNRTAQRLGYESFNGEWLKRIE